MDPSAGAAEVHAHLADSKHDEALTAAQDALLVAQETEDRTGGTGHAPVIMGVAHGDGTVVTWG